MMAQRIASLGWYCLAVLIAVGILGLLFNFLHHAQQGLSSNLLEPATTYSGSVPWQSTQTYVVPIFVGLFSTLSLIAACYFRRNRVIWMTIALIGGVIVLAVLLPWSPLARSLQSSAVTGQSSAQNILMGPQRVALIFAVLVALLTLSLRWTPSFGPGGGPHPLLKPLYILLLIALIVLLLGLSCHPLLTGSGAGGLQPGGDGGGHPAEHEGGGGQAIRLENGLELDTSGGGISEELAVKGPTHPPNTPVFKVRGAENVGYLRQAVGETYTGVSWRKPSEEPVQPIQGGQDLPLPVFHTARQFSTALVEVAPILPVGPKAIPSSLYTTEPEAPVFLQFRPYSLVVESAEAMQTDYHWQALSPGVEPEELRIAKTAALTGSLYQLPETLPTRVVDLAFQLTHDKETEYDKLEAIRLYLVQNYIYDLDNAATPPGRDAIDFFLFTDKRGVCATFSSAFVVLARSADIPARVVGGWAISPTKEEQVVRANQAHMWAEVPFEGLGWVTFEATPGGPPSRVAKPEPAPTPTPEPTLTPTPTPTPSPAPMPGPSQDSIELENYLELDTTGGGISDEMGIKGPVHPPDTPVFKVRGAENVGYLRQAVGETYTGVSWRKPSGEAVQPIQARQELPLPGFHTSRQFTTTLVEVTPILPVGPKAIPSSLYTTQPEAPVALQFRPHSLVVESAEAMHTDYRWQALSPVLKSDDVRAARTVLVSDSLLQLTDSLPQRVKDLAHIITHDKETEYDKLEAIRQYLVSNYTYDLDNASTPPGRDAIDFFLFEDRRGVCATFSSAFVVLARSADIPARVVGGWAIAPTEAEQVVRAYQAHMWAEVPFEGLGWVTFEATPGGPPDRVPAAQPAPTPTPPPNPMARLVPTATEITSLSSRIRRGEPATVSGTVTAQDGSVVGGLAVEVFINEEKAHGGRWIGQGKAEQGQFQVEIVIPHDLPLGNYQIIAHAIGNAIYAESWSDPQVEVYSGTHLTLVGPLEALVDEPVSITGQILQESGQPVTEGEVEITVEGQKLKLAPSQEGAFEFTHRFQEPGLQTVMAYYTGTRLLLDKSAELQVRIVMPVDLSLEWPRRIELGQDFQLNGELTDQTGAPIPGSQLVVEVTPDIGAASIATNETGGFNWQQTFDRPGRYSINVRYPGDEVHAPTSASAEVTVLVPTQVTLKTPIEGYVLDPISMRGSVKDGAGNLVPDAEVLLTIEPSTNFNARLTTDASGSFMMDHTFDRAGEYVIRAVFPGGDPYLPSEAMARIGVVSATILPESEGVITRGLEAFFRGRMLLKGTPLAGEAVQLLWDGQPRAEGVTDAGGVFSFQLTPEPGSALGVHQASYIVPRFQERVDQAVLVKAATSLLATLPVDANKGSMLTVSTRLVDDAGSPVAGVQIDSEQSEIQVTSNALGESILKIEVPEKMAGPVFIFEVQSRGDRLYWPASRTFGVPISQGPNLVFIGGFVIASLTSFAVGGGLMFWLRRRTLAPALRGATAPSTLESLPTYKQEEQGPAHTTELSAAPASSVTSVTISFPQIQSPFPEVWGVGEPFIIRCSLTSEKGSALDGASVRLSVEGQQEKMMTTGSDGTCQVELSFAEKGTYFVVCEYAGASNLLPSQSRRSLRVVEYREEIVQLFNSFIAELRSRSVAIPGDATPRDIENILVSNQHVHDERLLDEFLNGFEVADYSLHPIGRRQYEMAYRSYHGLTLS